MIKIRTELCTGCGRCAEGCPQSAISIVNGHARINQKSCNGCGLCLRLCPGGAIVEAAVISREKLAVTVGSLKQKADAIIERIEELQLKK